MISHKLSLKNGLQDNNWVGHSVMKTIDYQEFQKMNSIREVKNPDKPATKTVNAAEDINNKNYESSDFFEMEVIAEGTIEK